METIWTETTALKKREPLQGDMEAEVVIIGAGLAGILTGYLLKENGIHAVILEADRVAGGQTKGTTAKITSQHNLIYSDLIRVYGTTKARHYAGFHEWAVEEYARVAEEKKIACDYVRCAANLYSCVETAALEKEAEAARLLGIQAEYKTKCELPFPVKGVLEYKNQAKVHPLKFIKGIEEELQIFENTRVTKVLSEYEGKTGQPGKNRRVSRVVTDRGIVTAEKVVFACHFPSVIVPGFYFAKMYQSRSYVLALEGAGKFQNYYLGIDENGYSFRNEGELLLIGGESHRTGKNENGGKYQNLLKKAKEWWPDCKVLYQWSAQDCMTLDHIPYIGRFSRREDGWYVADGFGKWGMTSSMVSARIITSQILGMKVPEADIFLPQRKISAAGINRFVKNQTEAVKGLLSCKDTKRCTHLGCKLSWNADENTWDCPCHGSRFSIEGKVLSGPAAKDLSGGETL